MRSFEWFIAWRYLFNRERRALVSIITLIATLGVAVGVGALLVVIGVVEGVDQLIFSKITELNPHIRIVHTAAQSDPDLDAQLIEQLRATPGVERVEKVLNEQAILENTLGGETYTAAIQLIAQDRLGPDSLFKLSDIETGQTIILGEREILLGVPLAQRIGGYQGKPIRVNSTELVRTALYPTYKSMQFNVLGHFRTGLFDFDANTAFIRRDDMLDLFRRVGDYSYIHVKLAQPFQADRLKNQFDWPQGYRVSTWGEENRAFFGALKLEKLGLSIILLLVVIVAAFNIIGTLILMVIEKTREVGILKATGASDGQIARIFLLDGIVIGLVGTLLGLVGGLTLCAIIPRIDLPLQTIVYTMRNLPVDVRPGTVLLIVFAALAICTGAALYPARQAAKLDPVEALRHD